MKLTIRKTKPSDWKIIQHLNNKVFENGAQYDDQLNLKWPFSKQGIAYYKKVVKDPKYFCRIAEINGKPVSYIVGMENNFSYRNNKVGEIDNMGTLPDFRSQGIGTKLVKKFKAWCTKQGVTHIKVCTYFQSKRAINFYKKHDLLPIDITLEGRI